MRTKIIATVGPSCLTKEKIESLIQNGVTCFRVNLSHGTKSEKSKCFDLLRSCKLESGIRTNNSSGSCRSKNSSNQVKKTHQN